jgi:[ribosomal protein S18]-alanine N-acetyltransferase
MMSPFSIRGRGQPPVIRPLSNVLADECAVLHSTAFAYSWGEHEFERLISASNAFGDAALDPKRNTLLGFILSRVAADEAEVLTVVVAPNQRKRGIGRNLVASHLARLRNVRVKALFLEVGETNTAARKLYAGLGFVEVGRRKNYYRPNESSEQVAALVLRREIDPTQRRGWDA